MMNDKVRKSDNYVAAVKIKGKDCFNLTSELIETVEKNRMSYQKLHYFLLSLYDKQNGIQSHHVAGEAEKNGYETGHAFIRDASTQKSYSERLAPDSVLFAAINYLSRSLSQVRVLDKLLAERAKLVSNKMYYTVQRNKLRRIFSKEMQIIQKIIDTSLKDDAVNKKSDKIILSRLRIIEKAFSSKIVEVIHHNNFDAGLSTAKDYAKLLNYYRNLSSVLDPAATIVTTSYSADLGLTVVDRADPVVAKNKLQQTAFDAQVSLEQYGQTHHTKLPLAYQEANIAFLEQFKSSNRRMASAMRATHPHSVKNAYKVTCTVQKNGEKDVSIKFSRGGSLAYTGKHVSKKDRIYATYQNLRQLQAKSVQILNTDIMDHARQDRMVQESRIASKRQKNFYNYTPANDIGTLAGAVVANKSADYFRSPLDKVKTTEHVVNVAYDAAQKFGHEHYFSCASGQDRTGTISLGVKRKFLSEQVAAQNPVDQTKELEYLLAGPQHDAILASFAKPGSPGLKTVSQPINRFISTKSYFNQDTLNSLYSKEADKNKAPLIDSKGILKAISKPASNEAKGSLFSIIKKLQAREQHRNAFIELFRDQKLRERKQDALYLLSSKLCELHRGKIINYSKEFDFDRKIAEKLSSGENVTLGDIIDVWKKSTFNDSTQTFGELLKEKRDFSIFRRAKTSTGSSELLEKILKENKDLEIKFSEKEKHTPQSDSKPRL